MCVATVSVARSGRDEAPRRVGLAQTRNVPEQQQQQEEQQQQQQQQQQEEEHQEEEHEEEEEVSRHLR